jgi:hypothetical protein
MAKREVLTNRKPADELAWLRQQIRDLQEREDYIKRMIVSGDMSPEGDEHFVIVEDRTQNRLDREKIKARLGKDLSAFMTLRTYSICKVKERPAVEDSVVEDIF